ncbi:MAG: ATP-binding protein [Gemmatimonadota bacterium]|nr:MAG: ATP-binding protein [Gemmatimonadota bacterium]
MEFERLGVFYLGRLYDVGSTELLDPLVMYDARDLTTHGVCVGMTGSGKTGLCIGLLEEAALDGVPAIILDPKGDITNLLLTFPELRPEDFLPWVNPDDARRQGLEIEAFAASQAELWRRGLADWGQGGERIQALRAAAEFAVYTPGSPAGIPVSVLGSLAAPRASWATDAEPLRERIAGLASGLLGLVGVEADPARSREHVLLANLIEHYWRQGYALDLPTLIGAIAKPPIRQLGAFDIDTFYPEKERLELAMRLNTLIASPSFKEWLEGVPLDVPSFLSTPAGKPRHSIFYIAHLSEAERMFFVTLLLDEVITWMRAQPGTSSLRALLYMDEVFGFLPPVAEPPSKRPFLTLLKQARAYGVGLLLATQNPVDLDYKALSNAGTWFIGRMQTERDKLRVLDGLEGASSNAGKSLPRKELDNIISALGKRVFLLHNVHETGPTTFHTRWAMSYLRGPLTRPQVRELMGEQAVGEAAMQPVAAQVTRQTAGTEGPPPQRETPAAGPPAVAAAVRQYFLPTLRAPGDGTGGAIPGVSERAGAAQLAYRPAVLGMASVSFVDRKRGTDEVQSVALLAVPDSGGGVDWAEASELGFDPAALQSAPGGKATYSPLPASLNDERDLKRAARELSDHLYRTRRLTLLACPSLGEYSAPGASASEFALQLRQGVREARDGETDKVRDRFEKRLRQLEDRLRRAELTLLKKQETASARKRETMVSVGESLLGVFLGRRSMRGASTSLGKYRQQASARLSAEEAEARVQQLEAEIEELREELSEETAEIRARWEEALEEFEEVELSPRRADVDVEVVAIGWVPYWRQPDGREEPAT